MHADTVVNISPVKAGVVMGSWANLVQVPFDNVVTSLGDLNQMLAMAKSGLSAKEYLSGCCPATTIEPGKVIVKLGAVVYPSNIGMS